jgi:hypothetical protein
MRTLIVAATLVSIVGPALAQTQPTRQSAYATPSTTQSAFATASLNPCYSSTRVSFNPTSPCYTGGPYLSYSAIPATFSLAKPKASLPGADELDEPKAKSRIKDKGYLDVSELKQDLHGIWRGRARLKNGRPVEVILDLEGNIYSEPK